MHIDRERYLEKLKSKMHNKRIKVITGIRRCGKSYLLFTIFKKYLIDIGVKEDHIISIQLDDLRNKKYRDPEIIFNHIESKIIDKENYYVILDEIQMLKDFEEVLNTLLHFDNIDVYVTGSNSKFLSKDIITEFRGRGDEIHVYPLSFKEFMDAYPKDKYEGWAEYVSYGGLPLTLFMPNAEEKEEYLKNLFTETYLKDVIERNTVEHIQEMEDLLNILASNIGALSNAPKIHATFETEIYSNISLNTIRKYIEILKDAFLINESQRYDVKGRKYIGSPVKYYFEDVGLRNARLGFRQIEESHIMENIIYNELRIRGFNVDVGVVYKREKIDSSSKAKQMEVDFVANKGSRKYYIQSALNLPTKEKIDQEKASLISIRDSFKKIVIVKEVTTVKHDEEGITYMSIYDFLLNQDSLDW